MLFFRMAEAAIAELTKIVKAGRLLTAQSL